MLLKKFANCNDSNCFSSRDVRQDRALWVTQFLLAVPHLEEIPGRRNLISRAAGQGDVPEIRDALIRLRPGELLKRGCPAPRRRCRQRAVRRRLIPFGSRPGYGVVLTWIKWKSASNSSQPICPKPTGSRSTSSPLWHRPSVKLIGSRMKSNSNWSFRIGGLSSVFTAVNAAQRSPRRAVGAGSVGTGV
jgi:hypothetical protein